ncbi:site-specific integrase [Patescibacteria group bacterium]|nr:site-specific integrase [Patescibacteria group bacterium]
MKQRDYFLGYYPSQDPILKLKQEMKLRNFSPQTIKSYIYYITDILKNANKNPLQINNIDIKRYLDYLNNKGFPSSSLNIVINALKFYYTQILKRKLFFDIKRTKKSKYLPVVLSKQEIQKMIEAIDNPKHKFVIQLLYSTGLRVSEVVKIKMSDIDLDRKLILVKAGKGNKDRYTIR